MQLTINTVNPDLITYAAGDLAFSILGGIRLEGLDRLRVTLKIELREGAAPALRHNLDLYNDFQVEKLVRKTAERLEIGTIQLTRSLADITEQLEHYRLLQIAARDKEQTLKLKVLTEEERREAVSFLQQPALLQRTNALIGKSGVIGETSNRLLMYLIFTSRKRQNPLHIISFGSSGAGKSHLQEKVAQLIPEEDRIESTSLTSNALYYFGEYDLHHKLILIEDMDGADAALYTLRELISKKHITKLVPIKDSKGLTRTMTFTVAGPVTVAGCTTQEKVYEDNANRSFLIYIDESREQDEAVMAYQRRASAGNTDHEEERNIRQLLQNTQRVLQPVNIRNPYAEQLKIPGDVLKPRRTNAHYLQFIEAVTFYHQYQRPHQTDPHTGEVYIETTLEDIEEANDLMKAVLLRKADDLSGACRNYFEQLKHYLRQQEKRTFSNNEIGRHLRIPGTTLRRYHNELLQNGYIKRDEQEKSKSFRYEVVSYLEYDELRGRIDDVLDNILGSLKRHRRENGGFAS